MQIIKTRRIAMFHLDIHLIKRPLIALTLAASLAADASGDPPSDALLEAVGQLDARSDYRWTRLTETSIGGRSNSGRIDAEAIDEQSTRAVIKWGRFDTEVFLRGDRAAVRNRDGSWEAVLLADEGYRSEGFAATTARSIPLPAVEARQLIAMASELRSEADTLIGELPLSEAKQRLASRRVGQEDIREASGTVEFRIGGGQLESYKITVVGTVRDEGTDRATSQTFEVKIYPRAEVAVAVPEDAEDALRRPLPEPQKRLSDAEADEWLSARGRRNAEVHDPSSIVRSNDRYWLFATGTGVQSWSSNDLTTWERGPRVFAETPPWVTEVVPDQRGHFWAPDVFELDGRYLLYYSISSFGVNTSAIALATSPTLDPSDPSYRWTDHGIIIRSKQGDSFNAIDPAVFEAADGRLWMSFGSFWDGIKLVELDRQSGKRIASKSPVYSLARHEAIEAPHIYYHDGYYYLFVNWGACCRGVDSTYNVRLGRSREVTGPYLDKDGEDLAARGGTLLLESEGPFIGPGHANIFHDGERHWFSCHFYDATARGRAKLAVRKLRWAEDGWPAVDFYNRR